MTYFLIILIAMIIISAVDIVFFCAPYGIEWWYVVVAVIISTVVEIMISGLIAFAVRWLLPHKWFAIDKKFYAAGKKESAPETKASKPINLAFCARSTYLITSIAMIITAIGTMFLKKLPTVSGVLDL